MSLVHEWALNLGLVKPTRYDRLPRLKPGDLAIDCGANIGQETSVLAKSGATIHAFEPQPEAFAFLAKRMKNYPNVVCHNQAVGIKKGKLKLYQHIQSKQDPIKWSVGASLLPYKNNVNPKDFVEVEVINLAKFITSLNRPVQLVKMDVEGVECEILTDLITKDLHKRVGLFLVETHERIPELAEPTAKLKRLIAKERIANIHLDWV